MPADIEAELNALHDMTTGELADLYRELHGQPCRTRHRAYLIRKNAWRIQANAEGDLSERARRRAAELADDAEVRVMPPKTVVCPPQTGDTMTVTKAVRKDGRQQAIDPRLPTPSSAIVRKYKGRSYRVVVQADGQFECEGHRYRTLSAVAILAFAARRHAEWLSEIGVCPPDIAKLIRNDVAYITSVLDRERQDVAAPPPASAGSPTLGDVGPRSPGPPRATTPTPTLFDATRGDVGQKGPSEVITAGP